MSNKKLRVLFITDLFPSEHHEVSGVFVRNHAKAAALYNEVLVFYPFFYSLFPYLKWLFRKEKAMEGLNDGLKVIRIRIPFFNVSGWAGYILKIPSFAVYVGLSYIMLKHIIREFKPDVIHAHVAFPAGFVAALISRRYGKPLVLTEHAGPFAILMSTPIHRRFVRYAVETASVVLPVSRALKDHIEEFFHLGRVEIVPNLVDRGVFHYSKFQGCKGDILFVGLFHEVKGIDVLLEAVAMLKREGKKDFRLHLVGGGPARLEKRYRKMAEDLSITDIVIFHGRKSHREVAEFMARCSFLVLPSRAETFSCVVIEAHASGRPVLATRCGGPEEIINEGNGFLVAPGDPKELKSGLEHILGYVGYFDGERISKEAIEKYSIERIGQRLTDIYRSVVILH